MDVFFAHLGADEAWMGSIHQDIWMLMLSDLAVEVSSVQDGR